MKTYTINFGTDGLWHLWFDGCDVFQSYIWSRCWDFAAKL